MIHIGWNEYVNDVDTLCELLEEIDLTNCVGIHGVPRGGLIPAVIISHKLGLPLDHREVPEVDESKNEWVLIVDDLFDSGETYTQYKKMNPEGMLFVTVYRKDHSNQDNRPDTYVRNIETDKWIIFPYEDSEKAGEDMEEYYERVNATR